MEYYQHHIGDFRAATRHLSLAERQVYLELMWTYYDKEQPLPDDIPKLARRLGTEPEIVSDVLSDFFFLEDDGWHHERCDHELEKFHDRVEAASRAGKASAASRRAKKNGRSTTVKRASTNPQPPNTHNPLPSTVPDKQERTKKPAVFLAPDLSEVTTHWSNEKLNGDPEEFWNHFENCDWRLSGGRGKKMKNWKLAAANWSKRQPIFDPRSGGKRDGKLSLPRSDDGLIQFAEIHGLSKPRSGEDWPTYRNRLNAELEIRNSGEGRN